MYVHCTGHVEVPAGRAAWLTGTVDEDVASGTRSVVVEVVLLRASPLLAYRIVVASPLRGEAPDTAALRVAGLPPGAWERRDLVVHSTSWRYDGAGRVVLTYAVLPDPDPKQPAVALTDRRIARGKAPGRPTPERVTVNEVVAHAVRHLAFLFSCDPEVRPAIERVPDLAVALRDWEPDVAGALPARA